MTGVVASGTLYVDQFIAGVRQGRVKFPGTAKFSIKPNADLVEATSKDRGKYGQVVTSVAITRPADLSVTLTEITGAALAMALQGSAETLTQGSGSLVAQSFTNVKKGTYVPLGFINIESAGFAVTDSDGDPTYVKDTDYSIDYQNGMLYIIPGGAIANAQTIKVSCTYSAVSGTKILGATTPQVYGELFLDGENLVDGKPLQITVWEANLTADGEVDFLSDQPIELSMKGRMTTPTAKSSPFEISYDLAFS